MALSTLEAQGAAANANPNIVSNTYTGNAAQGAGAPLTQPATPPVTPPAAVTGIPGMQQAQAAATDVSNQLYQGGGGMVSGLETQRNAMMSELYDYDRMLDQVYAGQSYFPQTQGYVDNPADLVSGLSSMASATGANIGRTAAAVDTTERAYNMAISNVMDRFLSFYQMEQAQRQWEREMSLKEKEASGGGEKTEKQRRAMAALYGTTPEAIESGADLSAMKPTQSGAILASSIDPENSKLYHDILKDASGGNLTATQQTNLAKAESAKRTIQSMWDTYQKLAPTAKGVEAQSIGGIVNVLSGERFRTNLPGQYDQLREGLAAQIARSVAGESGVLNEGDIKRAMSLIPSRFETEEQARARFQNLMAWADDNSKLAAGNFSGQTQLPNINAGAGVVPQVTAAENTGKIKVYDKKSGSYGWAEQRDLNLEPDRFVKL
jgi:hypothetical protein